MAERIVESEDVIDGQLWIAFAKGTGSKEVGLGAVASLVKLCGPLRPSIQEQWASQGKVITDLARSFGERAAQKATAEGSELIEAQHIEALMATIKVECPC